MKDVQIKSSEEVISKTKEALNRRMEVAVQNISDFLQSIDTNRVD